VGGHPQPLAAFYAVSCLDAMRASLNEGDKSLLGMLQKLDVRYVSEVELRDVDPQFRSFLIWIRRRIISRRRSEDAMEHLSVTAAQRCVLESVGLLGTESVKLEQALGRVLAEDIRANRDQPPYDVSAMDGFALRSSDVANVPLSSKSSRTSRRAIYRADGAGRAVRTHHDRRAMPPGADAVIRVEDTQALAGGKVEIKVSVKPRNDIAIAART